MSEENSETDAGESSERQGVTDAGPIVAHYGAYFRNTRYLLTIVFVVFGIWSIYHGFVLYPRENAAWNPAHGVKPPHGPYDAPLNKVMGIILPPLGIFVLIRALHNSRGEYRLEGETVYVPGHPPVPLSAIRKIDKKLWERKGIAYVEYELGEPAKRATFKLDDFVYEREPTDKILERIEAYAAAVSAAPAAAENEGA